MNRIIQKGGGPAH